MNYSIQVALLSLVAFAWFGQVSEARTVKQEITLPKTVEAAHRGMPACGNPGGYTTADVIVDGAGRYIDSVIAEQSGYGIPLATVALKFDAVRSWLKVRLGVHNGKAACATICVAYPGSAASPGYGSGNWYVSVYDLTAGGSTNNIRPGTEFGEVGWAYLSSVTHRRTNRGNTVTCANVRHWKHDRRRKFILTVKY